MPALGPWELIILGVIAVPIVLVLRGLFGRKSERVELAPKSPMDFTYVRSKQLDESATLLGDEYINIDNTSGYGDVTQKRALTHAYTTSISVQRTAEMSAGATAKLWPVLEAELKATLSKTLGIELGQQESETTEMTFTAPAGKRVLYKISWRQSVLSGLAEMKIGKVSVQIPYTAYHRLQSPRIQAVKEETR